MYKSLLLIIVALILHSCSNAQQENSKSSLSAIEFAEQLKNNADIQLLDVRTPSEFKKGHVANAINANINDDNFSAQVAGLDKAKPIFVYCLSGPRSNAAANQLRASGFKNVVELPGGMMEWRANNLPETKEASATTSKGLSLAQYEALTKSDKLVLVDFYAEWCAPCKEMKPYLDRISKDMANNVEIVRIDADANVEICKILKIDALPVLKLYKNEKLIWDNLGFVDEATVRKKLTKN